MEHYLIAQGATPDEVKLAGLFLPHSTETRLNTLNSRTRFVHYTSASAAASIIENRSIWLRSTTSMNDFREIHFGIDQLIGCLGRKRETDTARSFWGLLEQLGDGLPQQVIEVYDGLLDDLRLNTYLFSLSEHNASEDEIGRLSMWRAYGCETGVALVINGRSLYSYSDALSTYSYPVFYGDADATEAHFAALVSNLIQQKEYLAQIPSGHITDLVFEMLTSYSICLKHPGFREEREWRVVHQPKQRPSSRVTPRKAEIRGVPQIVYELPLADIPEASLFGLEPDELIDRIIIGPTKYPLVMFDYFCAALDNVGVKEPAKRVFISHIPLRT